MSNAPARSLYLRGILLAAAGMTVLSPDGLLIKTVDPVPLWDLLFWRTFGLGTSLLVLLAAIYRSRLWTMLRSQGLPGLASAVLMALANILFVVAMRGTTVADTLVIMATMPFWSALLGLLLIGEAVRRGTWIAIAVALAGVAIIVAGSLDGGGLGDGSFAGDMAALGAALAHGLNLVVLRHAGDRDMTAALMGSGFLVALVCLPMLEPSAVPGAAWPVLGVLGFVLLPVALSLFLAGARYAPAAEVALLSLVETVLGPLLAWLVIAERPSTEALIGGALVVVAVAGNALAGVVARRRTGPTGADGSAAGPEDVS